MKKYIGITLVGISISSMLGWQRLNSVSSELLHVSRYSSGSNAGYTGAPGEGNCTNCHTGTVQSGENENIFTISQGGFISDEYSPGEIYDVSVSTVSNVTRKGFQITALDENNTPAGTFVASSNTQLKNGVGAIQGRKYVTHNSGNNAPTGWEFTWTAPNSIVGEITFYLATNKTNASNSSAGDVIYLSQYSLNTSAGLVEKTSLNKNFEVGYSPESHQLIIHFEDLAPGEMFLNLVDLNGKSVFTQKLGKSLEGSNTQKIKLPNDLVSGIHFVNFFVDNKALAGKVLVSK